MPDSDSTPAAWATPFLEEPAFLPPLPPVTLRSAWRNIVFFLLTVVSVFSTYGLISRDLPNAPSTWAIDWVAGTQMVVALLAILLAHEFGHYFAARYYRVDASLPYFLPFPFSFSGTLGAFIRIRAPFPHRRALFDVGLAGPFAGFLVCLPVLALGVLQGRWVPMIDTGEGPGYLGEPLLFQWAVALIKGPSPADSTLLIGPLGMAAWFGLLVTALNLIPVGQLDGGHAVYALLPRYAQLVSRLGLLACLVLVYNRPTWILWATLLLLLGRRGHPPTLMDWQPVGRGRAWTGLLALGVFAVCFTPNPVLVSWSEFADSLRQLLGIR